MSKRILYTVLVLVIALSVVMLFASCDRDKDKRDPSEDKGPVELDIESMEAFDMIIESLNLADTADSDLFSMSLNVDAAVNDKNYTLSFKGNFNKSNPAGSGLSFNLFEEKRFARRRILYK